MENIQKILAESDAPQEVKDQALLLTVQVAAPIAGASRSDGAAFGDGQFLEMMMRLIEMLLPILLKMLTT